MELLGWIGKPVVVLVNQLGAPRAGDVEAAEVARWRASLSSYPHVRAVLPLDAFARCWVQELTLFAAVEAALPEAKRPAMARLRDAWRARRVATFEAAVQAIAASLARIATMSETLPDAGGVRARLRQAGAAIGIGSAEPGPAAVAQRSLAARLDDEVRANTRELLALHGLGGAAEGEIRERLAAGYDLRLRLDETQAAMWGGAVTGALVGLKADLLSGGLTLGGGLIAGGVLGALGSAGPGALRQPRSRHRPLVRHLERGRARHHGRGGAAAPARGRALRPRPRRLGAGRGAAALGRRRRRRARAAARGARRRLVGARCQAAGRRCHTRRAAGAGRERSGARVAATALSGRRARLAIRPFRGAKR